jgi:hypothetical protein
MAAMSPQVRRMVAGASGLGQIHGERIRKPRYIEGGRGLCIAKGWKVVSQLTDGLVRRESETVQRTNEPSSE